MIKSKPCIVEGCSYPRFAKGYCKLHQSLRDDKKPKVLKKKSYIKPISDKTKMDKEKYKETKALKQENYIKENKWVCFFSGEPLEISPLTSFHHLYGKQNHLLYEYDNIEPVLDSYHMSFHHDSVIKLLKEKWYVDFLSRIKDTHPKLFAKEERRIDKSFA